MENNPFELIEEILKEAKESHLFDNNIYYMVDSNKYIFRDRILKRQIVFNMLLFDFIEKVGECKHQGEKAIKYIITE